MTTNEQEGHNDERLNASPLLHSGTILVVGAGLGGVINAIFNLLFLRVTSPSLYSSVGPLLAIGTLCASASVGIEYVAISLITRANSYAPVVRQLFRLALPSVLALALTPLVSSYLHVSGLNAFLGILLGSLTLFAALPTAMLVARGMLVASVTIAFIEAVVRCCSLVFAHEVDPVFLALVASVGVTAVGGLIMALYAMRRSRGAIPRETAHHGGDSQLLKSLLAIGLYLPLTIPTWMARHFLSAEVAGVIAFAAFLGSGVMMFAGPVTSALIPRTKAIGEKATIRSGAMLTLAFALLAAIVVMVAGPLIFPSLVGAPLPGFREALIPLCVSGTLWAVAAYFSWVLSANGHSSLLFTLAAVFGIAAELMVSSFVHSQAAITWSPLLALGVYAMAFVVIRFRKQKAIPIH